MFLSGFYCWWFHLHSGSRSPPWDAWWKDNIRRHNSSVDFSDTRSGCCALHFSCWVKCLILNDNTCLYCCRFPPREANAASILGWNEPYRCRFLYSGKLSPEENVHHCWCWSFDCASKLCAVRKVYIDILATQTLWWSLWESWTDASLDNMVLLSCYLSNFFISTTDFYMEEILGSDKQLWTPCLLLLYASWWQIQTVELFGAQLYVVDLIFIFVFMTTVYMTVFSLDFST